MGRTILFVVMTVAEITFAQTPAEPVGCDDPNNPFYSPADRAALLDTRTGPGHKTTIRKSASWHRGSLSLPLHQSMLAIHLGTNTHWPLTACV